MKHTSVMDAKTFDIEKARKNYQKRIAETQERRRNLWKTANEQADKAIRLIIDRYNPQRVIQWGSVIRPEYSTENSDIDIAVEGITDPETWSKLEQDLETIVTFPLDLVRFERIHAERRKQILSRGKVVYEK